MVRGQYSIILDSFNMEVCLGRELVIDQVGKAAVGLEKHAWGAPCFDLLKLLITE